MYGGVLECPLYYRLIYLYLFDLGISVNFDHFMPLYYRYSVTSAFERDANDAVLDLTMDDDTRHKLKSQRKMWDPKKKKYVGQSNVSCRLADNELQYRKLPIIFTQHLPLTLLVVTR